MDFKMILTLLVVLLAGTSLVSADIDSLTVDLEPANPDTNDNLDCK